MNYNKFFEIIQNKKNILQEGGWVVTGQILVAVINLVGIRIVTEFLSAEVFGNATMWLGISVLLKNIFISPFLNYQIRFYPEYLQLNKLLNFNKIAFNVLLWLFVVSSLLFLIITISLMWLKIVNAEYIILFVVIIYFLMDVIKSYYINQYQAERKQNKYARWIIFEAVFMYSIIYLVLSKYPFAQSYIFSMALGILIGLLLFRDNKIAKNNYDAQHDLKFRQIMKQAKRFSLPFVPIAILSWIMNLSSRYFIGIIGSTFEAGIFVAAFSISSRPFIMLSGIATNFFRPILFEATSKEQIDKIKSVFKFWISSIIIVGIFIIGIFFFGGKYIAELLLAENYRINAVTLFVYIGLGYFLLAIYQVFENFMFALKKTKEILYATILGTIVFLTTNLILIKIYSTTGAAISFSISFAVQLIAIIYFFKSNKQNII